MVIGFRRQLPFSRWLSAYLGNQRKSRVHGKKRGEAHARGITPLYAGIQPACLHGRACTRRNRAAEWGAFVYQRSRAVFYARGSFLPALGKKKESGEAPEYSRARFAPPPFIGRQWPNKRFRSTSPSCVRAAHVYHARGQMLPIMYARVNAANPRGLLCMRACLNVGTRACVRYACVRLLMDRVQGRGWDRCLRTPKNAGESRATWRSCLYVVDQRSAASLHAAFQSHLLFSRFYRFFFFLFRLFCCFTEPLDEWLHWKGRRALVSFLLRLLN